jgi:hypothetical protein
MNRRLLQVVTAVLGIIPLATGLLGLTGVNDPLYAPVSTPHRIVLDTNLGFFSGAGTRPGAAVDRSIDRAEDKRLSRVVGDAVRGWDRQAALDRLYGHSAHPVHLLHPVGDRRRPGVHLLAAACGAGRTGCELRQGCVLTPRSRRRFLRALSFTTACEHGRRRWLQPAAVECFSPADSAPTTSCRSRSPPNDYLVS